MKHNAERKKDRKDERNKKTTTLWNMDSPYICRMVKYRILWAFNTCVTHNQFSCFFRPLSKTSSMMLLQLSYTFGDDYDDDTLVVPSFLLHSFIMIGARRVSFFWFLVFSSLIAHAPTTNSYEYSIHYFSFLGIWMCTEYRYVCLVFCCCCKHRIYIRSQLEMIPINPNRKHRSAEMNRYFIRRQIFSFHHLEYNDVVGCNLHVTLVVTSLLNIIYHFSLLLAQCFFFFFSLSLPRGCQMIRHSEIRDYLLIFFRFITY